MKKIILAVIIICSFGSLAFCDVERPSTKKEVFFQGTNHELEVYKIYGRQDGPTMLIVGGIQGDEPGGFLSADSYADIRLEKGNLIVVPRMNFYSILLFNREVKGVDMNRLFDKVPNDWQGDVVNKVKEYMKESDIFLNLHDGWGYHYPEYVSWQKSPERFGYSVIVDEEEYTCKDGTVLKLGEMAKKAMNAANAKIPADDPKKHYFNTETDKQSSRFKSMRKSATWYAVSDLCLPSFGIEGSKNMKIEKNVLYHNYVINEFMKIVGIEIEYPNIHIHKAELKGAVIKVDNEERFIRNNQVLEVEKGKEITVTEIISNHQRGLSCDILNFGNLNDLNKPYKIEKDTKVIFRKDNNIMGSITLKAAAKKASDINAANNKSENNKIENIQAEKNTTPVNAVQSEQLLEKGIKYFYVSKDNKSLSIKNGDTLHVTKNSVIKLIKLYSIENNDYNYSLNFKGWFPEGQAVNNDGDDRGYDIAFPLKNVLKKYSKDGKGKIYPIVATDNNKKVVAKMYVEID